MTAGTLAPIRRSVHVRCSVEHAFRTFTRGLDAWWPLETHSLAAGTGRTVARVVLEEHVGGRLYEVVDDGAEHDWGRVTAWEPPHRLGIAWHVNPELPAPTQVDVTFHEADGGTRVELVHAGWERLAEHGTDQRASYEPGWAAVLGCYEALLTAD